MKKAVIIFLGIVFISTSLGIGKITEAVEEAVVSGENLSTGMKSEEIQAIQEVLKEDPAVYPEGYTTGYYGSLTKEAIKRLQKRFKISETGEIDSKTIQLVFPNLRVKVVSPNGGEIWKRDEIQTITWRVLMPTSDEEAKEENYFRPKASIDLFQKVTIAPTCIEATCKPIEKSIFVKHVANVGLFDMTYSWQIPNSIKNSDKYVIRISTGRNIVPALLKKDDIALKQIWNLTKNLNWDESDNVFTITGTTVEPQNPSIEEVIKILENISKEINKAILLLKGALVK